MTLEETKEEIHYYVICIFYHVACCLIQTNNTVNDGLISMFIIIVRHRKLYHGHLSWVTWHEEYGHQRSLVVMTLTQGVRRPFYDN